MVLGSVPTKEGIPSHQSEDICPHNVEACCNVCVCGQRRPLAVVTLAQDGAGKILSGPDFCGCDDIQIIANTHTHIYTGC